MFQLPRRGREQYDNTKVLVAHLNWMENRIMAALEDVVAELRSAITNANIRFENVGQLEQALADERAKYDALISAEDAEDVQQNQELADAKATTDHALAQVQGLTGTLTELTDQVNQLGNRAPAPEAPADVPAADTPTDTPAPVDTPVDTPDETADAPAPAEAEAPADVPADVEPSDEAPANPTP